VRLHHEKLPLGDVPPTAAARHMGMDPAVFEKELPALLARGFPPADPTTGNFDLDAIKAWRRARHPQFFGQPSLTPGPTARNAHDVVAQRLRARGGG
jgi:hypothetical protein